MLTVLWSLNERKPAVNGLLVKGNLDQLIKVGPSRAVQVSVQGQKLNPESNVNSYWEKQGDDMTKKGLLQRIQKLMGWFAEQGYL